jgi:hypothetical protein
MYRRYRQMISDKELYDRLGIVGDTREDDLPAEFLEWAREFDRIERGG